MSPKKYLQQTVFVSFTKTCPPMKTQTCHVQGSTCGRPQWQYRPARCHAGLWTSRPSRTPTQHPHGSARPAMLPSPWLRIQKSWQPPPPLQGPDSCATPFLRKQLEFHSVLDLIVLWKKFIFKCRLRAKSWMRQKCFNPHPNCCCCVAATTTAAAAPLQSFPVQRNVRCSIVFNMCAQFQGTLSPPSHHNDRCWM